MKPQQIYANLFTNYREVLRLHSSEAMDACRDEAFAAFRRLGMPDSRSEAYRYCRLDEALAVDYGVNLYRLAVPAHPSEVFRCDVPTLSTRLYFVVNDMYYPSKRPVQLPEGVICGSLNQMLKEHPQLGSWYGRLSAATDDGLAAMNTAFAQDGFVLYVPKGVTIDKPLQLIQMFQGEIDILATRRLLVILEEGASANLIVCDHAISTGQYFSNQVVEIFVGENAHLEYYEMEMTHPQTVRVSNTYISQASDSSLLMNGVQLENGLSRNNVYLRFDGKRAKADLSGLSLLGGEQLADNHIVVDHAQGNCCSNQLFKYILDGSSRGVFGGKVLVRPLAQQTQAFQSNANMCNSDRARMHSLPQLEIYADDVKCSHGSATGQIDEEALFYMRQRGIGAEQARMLLKLAFASDVIDRISLQPLQGRVRMLVEKCLRGQLANCTICQ